MEWTLVTLETVGGRPSAINPADDVPLVPLDVRAWLEKYPVPEGAMAPARRGCPPAVTKSGTGGQPPQPPAGPGSRVTRDVRLRRAMAYVEGIDGAVSGDWGHNQTFDVACALVKGFDLSLDDALSIMGAFNARCSPPWDLFELHHKLLDAHEKPDDKLRGYLLEAERGSDAGGGPGESQTSEPEDLSFSDPGNSHRLISKHGNKIRYRADRKSWATYDGRRWRIPGDLEVEDLAKDVAGVIRSEMPPTNDPGIVEIYATFAGRSESARAIADAMRLARSDRRVRVDSADLDRDPWLFNCLNGTIDLRTGKLRPHDSGDLITRIAGVEYDSQATCPRFDRFLEEVMDKDLEAIKFLDRFFGWSLTGDTSEHYLPIHFGEGSNGKDKLISVALQVLGDYAAIAEPDLLRASPQGKHAAGIAALRGRRFVAISEQDQATQIDEAVLKRLTGTGILTARGMGENFSSFRREAKIFLAVNHRPKFKGQDHGMWRRILQVDWPVQFAHPSEFKQPAGLGIKRLPIDPSLEQTLLAEASGILARWVRGCSDWQAGGLRPPESVILSTREYRHDLDSVREFIEKCCGIGTDLSCSGGDLHNRFQGWWIETEPEGDCLNSTQFGLDLGRIGHNFQKRSGIKFRLGLDLKTSASPPEGQQEDTCRTVDCPDRKPKYHIDLRLVQNRNDSFFWLHV